MIHVTQIMPYTSRLPRALPFFESPVKAGFPSPADDFLDKNIDLNELLIQHPAATFFVRVKGDSMVNAGIHSGDMLIVDRSLEPRHQHIVVAVVNGDFTVKRFVKRHDKTWLAAENPGFKPIEIKAGMDVEIWGVVVHAIHSV